jgi:hypothetical protein
LAALSKYLYFIKSFNPNPSPTAEGFVRLIDDSPVSKSYFVAVSVRLISLYREDRLVSSLLVGPNVMLIDMNNCFHTIPALSLNSFIAAKPLSPRAS